MTGLSTMGVVRSIDYRDLERNHPAAFDALADAFSDLGYVQLTNHDIEPALMRETFALMRGFFHSPKQQKQALSRSRENPWGYYDRELTKNRPDWKEIFDLGVDIEDGPIRAMSVWPQHLPAFKPVMLAYVAACERLCSKLLAHLCTTLGAPHASLASHFAPTHSSFLRLNYYPPCPDPAPRESHLDHVEGKLGIHRHTDAGALTVLATDGVPGLQMHVHGWRDVELDPRHFLINTGDLLEVWSNGRYPAPQHRVLANRERERFSAAFFYNPSFDTVCSPLEAAVVTGQAPRYRPVPWREFRLARAAGDYEDLGREIQLKDYLMTSER